MPDRIKKEEFAFLALLLIAVFSYPLISIADKNKTIQGVPVLYVYIFTCWIVSIILLYMIAERKSHPKNKKDE